MSQMVNTSNGKITHKHIECHAMEIKLMMHEFESKWSKLMLKLHQKYPEHLIPEDFKEYLPPESTV